ncbi:MAG: oligopeptide transport system substrate-binding protein [Rhodothermales bacterium]
MRYFAIVRSCLICIVLALLSGCFDNNPYPGQDPISKTFYFSYPAEVKYLDPGHAFNSGFSRIMIPIYEPPFEYHYLKRPVELSGRTVTEVPKPQRYGDDGALLPPGAPADQVAKVIYTLHLQDDIRFQDHACFAQDADGNYLYHLGDDGRFSAIDHPNELLANSAVVSKTRALHAEDYVYQFKRLANPETGFQLRQVFTPVIVGMPELSEQIAAESARIRAARREAAGPGYNQEKDEQERSIYIDLRPFDFPGVRALDAKTLEITLTRDFPQMLSWMALSFFAPMAWEACRFYEQPAAAKQNLSLDRYPVGTGPYMLTENLPNYRIVLERNPNYRRVEYPSEGAPGDREAGLLDDAGKALPFIDRVVYMLDKEAPPRWNKFLQGYYDLVELEPNDTDLSGQVMEVTLEGGTGVSPEMATRGITMHEGGRPFLRYYAFNMKDPVWGGLGEKQRKMRQAVSIALNLDEYIQIFENGRGAVSHSMIPAGIFGQRPGKEGINPVVYRWNEELERPELRPLEDAKRLLAEAGYPDGRDANGDQLILSYDLIASRGVKGVSDWMNKQLGPIGIRVVIRDTDSNRWLDKLQSGNFQFTYYGWIGDYPDAENFLFLLYGKNGKVDYSGENYANYANPEYDIRFKLVETMSNSPERQGIIDEMVAIAREDAPWLYAWQPKDYSLQHAWFRNYKIRYIGMDALKYWDIDPAMRAEMSREWNRPVTWPLWALAIVLVAGIAPPMMRRAARRRKGLQL